MLFQHKSQRPSADRRGVILVMSALLIVVVCAMAAMAIDVGYMLLVKTQLQVSADAGALAAGNALHLTPAEVVAVGEEYASKQTAGGRNVTTDEADVELGTWDSNTETFVPSATGGNAVRVTVRRDNESLFFARAIGRGTFSSEASAIVMDDPKDIAFVVDLSGSMNDDTEAAWATSTINDEFGPQGYPGIGSDLMQDFYTDMNFGTFPGDSEYIGQPLGVAQDKYAYAVMTADNGPLSEAGMDAAYKINPSDNEKTRKQKAYAWIIDNQLSRLIPNAHPAPDTSNYAYWEKYLDYVMRPVYIMPPPPPPEPSDDDDDDGGDDDDDDPPSPPPPPPPPPPPSPPPIGSLDHWQHRATQALAIGMRGLSPATRSLLVSPLTVSAVMLQATPGMPPEERGWLPPSQDGDRIHRFNNPNRQAFPSANGGLPYALRNWVGYLTYAQFLVDHGCDLQPDGTNYVEISLDSPHCPEHNEITAGGTFSFPPRCQPMHATRRSLIAAIDRVERRGEDVPVDNRDRVSIVTFDRGGDTQVLQALTGDYNQAMQASTRLQAVGDKGSSTATESGLIAAREHLRPPSEGGQGRESAKKVVVLLTDGMPNAYQSDSETINNHLAGSSNPDYYGGGYYWLDAPLMQTDLMQVGGADIYAVGVGLGADYNFLDRVARTGWTGGSAGQAKRSSGNPAEYEAKMTEIFKKIVSQPTARLVE